MSLVKNILVTVAVTLPGLGLAQFGPTEPCNLEPVQYLSAFVDVEALYATGEVPKWDVSDFEELVEEIKKDPSGLFVLPMAMIQIRDYYTKADWSPREMEIIYQVSQLFSYALGKGGLTSRPRGQDDACSALYSVKHLFERLCRDDKYYFDMQFTFDDGPFYGEDMGHSFPAVDSVHIDQMDSDLILGRKEGNFTLMLLDAKGSTQWNKILTGLDDRALGHVRFANNPIREHELGYKINLFADGEHLTLHLKENGDFRGYFHSW